MHRTIVALALLLAGILPLAAQPDPVKHWERDMANWQEMVDYEGQFRVKVPGVLQTQVDTITTSLGDLVYHTYYLQLPADSADNVMYMVSYCDYPEGTVHSDSAELVTELFDATVAAARESVRGEIRFDTDVKWQHYPGRYWRIDYLNDRASVRTKAYVVKNRYYALQTVSRNELGINPSTDRFMDSFSVF